MSAGIAYSHILVCIPTGEVVSGEYVANVGAVPVGCPSGLSPVYREGYLVTLASAEDLDAAVSAQSVWNMTPEQGGQIGVAILGVWAVAWAFKMVARFFINYGEGNENENC